ncbi:hypothetical protein H4S02_008140, partial [Coemansia sp. RSA 2611]
MASTSNTTSSSAAIKALLNQFQLKEVLNEDISTKTAWLLGTIGNGDDLDKVVPGKNAAVVTLERLAVFTQGIANPGASNL